MANPPTYYPSFTVRMGVRFDEDLKGVNLTATTDDAASDTFTPASAVPILQQRPSAADGLSFKTQFTPLRCTVEIPGYRAAGKFTIEVPFKDFPFEPDLVRAIAVEIYAGAVQAGDFARGQQGLGLTTSKAYSSGTSSFFNSSGGWRPSQLVPDDNPKSPGYNEVLVGIADVIRVEHTDKGDVVKIEGRDLRGILCDLPVPPQVLAGVNVTQPINRIVQYLVDRTPALKLAFGKSGQAGVDVQADDWPDGKVPAPNDPSLMTRVNLGAAGAQGAVGNALAGVSPMVTGSGDQLKLWDLITNFCLAVGAVPYFAGRRLRIRPTRALYDQQKLAGFDPRFPTPFAGGTQRGIRGVDGSIYATSIRVLAWGRDVLSLKRERKLGGVKVPTVVVHSVDTSSKQRGKARFLEAQWPPPPPQFGNSPAAIGKSRATTVTADGSVAQNVPIFISVPGVRSLPRLQQIARDIYEEVGRGELNGSCQTRDLASLGGDSTDPDLMRLRPGDPVRFVVDDRSLKTYPPTINSVADMYRRDPESVAAELTKRLGDADLARLIAYATTGKIGNRQTVYRVTNVRFAWDKESGVGVDFDFQNYVESRQDISRATSTTTKTNQKPVVKTDTAATQVPELQLG